MTSKWVTHAPLAKSLYLKISFIIYVSLTFWAATNSGKISEEAKASQNKVLADLCIQGNFKLAVGLLFLHDRVNDKMADVFAVAMT